MAFSTIVETTAAAPQVTVGASRTDELGPTATLDYYLTIAVLTAELAEDSKRGEEQ